MRKIFVQQRFCPKILRKQNFRKIFARDKIFAKQKFSAKILPFSSDRAALVGPDPTPEQPRLRGRRARRPKGRPVARKWPQIFGPTRKFCATKFSGPKICAEPARAGGPQPGPTQRPSSLGCEDVGPGDPRAAQSLENGPKFSARPENFVQQNFQGRKFVPSRRERAALSRARPNARAA